MSRKTPPPDSPPAPQALRQLSGLPGTASRHPLARAALRGDWRAALKGLERDASKAAAIAAFEATCRLDALCAAVPPEMWPGGKDDFLASPTTPTGLAAWASDDPLSWAWGEAVLRSMRRHKALAGVWALVDAQRPKLALIAARAGLWGSPEQEAHGLRCALGDAGRQDPRLWSAWQGWGEPQASELLVLARKKGLVFAPHNSSLLRSLAGAGFLRTTAAQWEASRADPESGPESAHRRLAGALAAFFRRDDWAAQWKACRPALPPELALAAAFQAFPAALAEQGLRPGDRQLIRRLDELWKILGVAPERAADIAARALALGDSPWPRCEEVVSWALSKGAVPERALWEEAARRSEGMLREDGVAILRLLLSDNRLGAPSDLLRHLARGSRREALKLALDLRAWSPAQKLRALGDAFAHPPNGVDAAHNARLSMIWRPEFDGRPSLGLFLEKACEGEWVEGAGFLLDHGAAIRGRAGRGRPLAFCLNSAFSGVRDIAERLGFDAMGPAAHEGIHRLWDELDDGSLPRPASARALEPWLAAAEAWELRQNVQSAQNQARAARSDGNGETPQPAGDAQFLGPSAKKPLRL